MRGRLTRCRCSHSASSNSSGTAMCRNTSNVKNRSSSASGARKLRAMGSPKIGNQSSHSVVVMATYCASWSHTSQ